jgi:hypothetical protein
LNKLSTSKTKAISAILTICVAFVCAEASEKPSLTGAIAKLAHSSTFPGIDTIARNLGVKVDKKFEPAAYSGELVYYPVLKNGSGIKGIQASETNVTISFDGSYCIKPTDIANAVGAQFAPDEALGVDGGPPERSLIARMDQVHFIRMPFVPVTGCAGYVSIHT